MKNVLVLFICFCLIQYSGFSQLYTNNSENLPSNGATGQSMDVQAADLDGDGDLDIVLANEFQRNTVLLNDGNAVFTNPQSIPNIAHDSEDVAIADYDDDGDMDLIFCSEDDQIHEYYLNDGAAGFTAHPTFQFPNSTANAVITADINNDDLPDIFFGNAGQNTVFINNGDGTFTDETNGRLPTASQTTQDLHLSDIDNDSDLDLIVGNEGSSKILINDGQGVFTDETNTRLPINALVETRKVSSGDINGDQFPDLFFSNVAFLPSSLPYRSNILFLNDGNGFFTDVSEAQLPSDNDDTLDAIFEDVDVDNDMDLVIANVNLQSTANQKVFLNDGNGNFTDESNSVLGTQYFNNALGLIAADLNNNGLNDLYFAERNTGGATKDYLFLKILVNADKNPITNLSDKISVQPNPANKSFTLNLPIEIPATDMNLLLTDSTGKKIANLISERVGNAQYHVSIKHLNLSSGSYFISSENKDWHFTKKIQIVH